MSTYPSLPCTIAGRSPFDETRLRWGGVGAVLMGVGLLFTEPAGIAIGLVMATLGVASLVLSAFGTKFWYDIPTPQRYVVGTGAVIGFVSFMAFLATGLLLYSFLQTWRSQSVVGDLHGPPSVGRLFRGAPHQLGGGRRGGGHSRRMGGRGRDRPGGCGHPQRALRRPGHRCARPAGRVGIGDLDQALRDADAAVAARPDDMSYFVRGKHPSRARHVRQALSGGLRPCPRAAARGRRPPGGSRRGLRARGAARARPP